MTGPILGGLPFQKINAANVNIIAAGNSIIYGQGTSNFATKPWVKAIQLLEPLSSTGLIVANKGVPGMTIAATKTGYSSMMATRQANVINNLVVGKINILLLGEFTNEVGAVMTNTGNTANGTLAHDAWVIYCQTVRAEAAAKGAAIRIVTTTTVPYGYQSYDAQSFKNKITDINENGFKVANELMRANWRAYADAIIDIAALPLFAAPFNSSNYSPTSVNPTGLYGLSGGGYDGVHYGDTGHAYSATAAATVLKKIPRRSFL